jgi:uncharacterized protein YndB with AHSA1/START domain
MENKNTSAAEKQKPIHIERTFDIPVSKMWRAWSEPESLKKWWGPEGYTCPSATIDFRVGGKYLASMKGEDGNEIWSTGTYKEIIPFKKIVNTDSFSDSKGNIISAAELNMPGEWPQELLITVEFKEVDGKTQMKLEHKGIPQEMYEDCIAGWQSSFDKLERNIK